MDKAKALTLPELLEKVPSDARLTITNDDEREILILPVGRHCHNAAAELRRLRAVNRELLEALLRIATVNAMDYEYQAWARAAIAKAEGEPK